MTASPRSLATADVAIYIFAFIPIATTVLLGVYSNIADPYFALVLDYVVVCTVNLNGTLNAIAFNYFLSAQGKKSVTVARVERGPPTARPRHAPHRLRPVTCDHIPPPRQLEDRASHVNLTASARGSSVFLCRGSALSIAPTTPSRSVKVAQESDGVCSAFAWSGKSVKVSDLRPEVLLSPRGPQMTEHV